MIWSYVELRVLQVLRAQKRKYNSYHGALFLVTCWEGRVEMAIYTTWNCNQNL